MSYDFAAVNGARIHYQSVGHGRALVLIHAGIAHLEMWDDQIEAFRQNYRVVRYDVRGWGQSALTSDAYAEHEDLRALLDHLQIEQAILLGASHGGKIAIDFTLTYPEHVAGLILMGPGLSGYQFRGADLRRFAELMNEAYEQGDMAGTAELIAQLWVDGPRRAAGAVRPGVRQRALAMIHTTLREPPSPALARELEPPALERLGAIQTPTLLILGEADADDIMAIGDLLTAGIAGITKATLPDTAHLPNMEQPEQFNRLVLDFLAG